MPVLLTIHQNTSKVIFPEIAFNSLLNLLKSNLASTSYGPQHLIRHRRSKRLRRQRRKVSEDTKSKSKLYRHRDVVKRSHKPSFYHQEQESRSSRVKRAATARPERIWDYAVIPYEIDSNFR